MKSLVEYINEQIVVEQPTEQQVDVTEGNENVWVVKDTDLNSILDVCETEDAANEAKEDHLKENADAHLEVSSCPRSEVEKKED